MPESTDGQRRCSHGFIVTSLGVPQCQLCNPPAKPTDNAIVPPEEVKLHTIGAIMAEVDKLAFQLVGEPLSIERDEVGMARYALLIHMIQQYADVSQYTDWNTLQHDIAEMFEFGWINPTPEQQRYIEAKTYVHTVEQQDLWNVRSQRRGSL